MNVDNQLILKLQQLARLELNPAEQQKIQHDLNNILKMIEKLSELDTSGVEPLVYLAEQTENRLRNDEVGNHITTESALKNAPNPSFPYFTAPKVL